ncbi:hypothetical protein KUTeg_010991 [Tegillarca granosa]|uniref:Uncharacterized protein n=1 Tax=Tegillarca granosa TaxID=220873 RepID=A0ABQ9F601_TEGGR|nr:hypothetical protein KUTeg_010991 [Tegillarca granosa]
MPKEELLDDISTVMMRMFHNQERRFDTRMKEFKNTMQNMLREEFSLMVSTKTSSTSVPDDVTPLPVTKSNEQHAPRAQGNNCLDGNNNEVPEGSIYHPYSNDFCVSCRCRNGQPFECVSVMCERPTCTNFKRVERRCCEYVCLNETSTTGTSSALPNPTITPNPAPNQNLPPENLITSQSVSTTSTSGTVETTVTTPSHSETTVTTPSHSVSTTSTSGTVETTVTTPSHSAPGIQIFGPSYINEGDSLSLTCVATFEEIPTTISWFHEGNKLSVENSIITTRVVIQDRRITSTLRKNNVSLLRDGGSYVCRTSENKIAFKRVHIMKASCRDWENNIVNHGERFSPEGNDPCFKCLCENGQQTACMSVSCARPECENFQVIEGKCCEFRCLLPNPIVNEIQQDAAIGSNGACIDRNGNTVTDGDLYTPDGEDLCLKCTCESGHPINCHMKACLPPKCQNYVRHKGECCQFTCLQDFKNSKNVGEDNQESGSCTDLNSTKVSNGDTFRPYRDDPCIFCTCKDGQLVFCGSEQCDKPACPNYTPVTDKVKLTMDTESNSLFFCGEPGCRLEYNRFLQNNENGHNISFSFKTISIDGMIYFTKSISNSSNYEMVWISNGRIVYSFDLGSGAVDIASQHLYNDDEWHKVTVSRYRNKGLLYVGDEEVHGVSPGDRNSLEKPGISYIGALSEDVTKPFLGCIRQLQYNGDAFGAPASMRYFASTRKLLEQNMQNENSPQNVLETYLSKPQSFLVLLEVYI